MLMKPALRRHRSDRDIDSGHRFRLGCAIAVERHRRIAAEPDRLIARDEPSITVK